MKKILFIIGSLNSGGAERQILTVARILKMYKYDISFFCVGKEGFYSKLAYQNNIEVEYYSFYVQTMKSFASLMKYLRLIFYVRKIIKNRKYNVVISFLGDDRSGGDNLINILSVIGRKGIKSIVGNRYTIDFSKRSSLLTWLELKTDKVVCNSYNSKMIWENHFPSFKKKIHTIYNASIIDELTSKYIPLRENKVHFLVAARYDENKNLLGLLDALIILGETTNNLVIDWYGEINTQNNYFNLCITKILTNKIKCINLFESTTDIHNKMLESDVIALFSKQEGMPNSICEGMSIGKPIVMTNVSDYKILVEENINGFICDWDSPTSIANALQKTTKLTIDELCNMGERSRIKANQMFSTEYVAKEWISIIENQDL